MDAEGSGGQRRELRDKLMGGLVRFADFAAAMNKHPKTVMKMGPPVTRVGRDVYVDEAKGRAWILNGCRPLEPERRGRGRKIS